MKSNSIRKILILVHDATAASSQGNKLLASYLEQNLTNVSIVLADLSDLVFEIDEDGMRAYDVKHNYSLDDFDLVFFRTIRGAQHQAASAASYLISKNIKYIDHRIKPYYYTKFSAQAMRFNNGIRAIPSIYASNRNLLYLIRNDKLFLNYPLIIKDNYGKKGRNNFLAQTKDQAIDIISNNMHVSFVIQKYIENDGDYRLLVLGEQIRLVIHRQSSGDSHLNNTSTGGCAEIKDKSDFADYILADVQKAAAIEDLDVAGVDLVIDKNSGKHYIIEVNQAPQLASGAFIDLKMNALADYIDDLI